AAIRTAREEVAMGAYVVLLRAVNVGGTGKLPMAELKAMCVAEGYERVQTYIASGNVVFATKAKPAAVKGALERRLAAFAGKSVGVIVRTARELADVVAANPFPKAAPNRTVAIFVDERLRDDALDDVRGRKDEELELGAREIFVHYGAGMGQ